MLDLRPMSDVTVDPSTQVVTVQGGALLGAVDRATQRHGLATTTGNVSHTGIGGLALGGGMGWLARQHGLTCDNLLACELVTAGGDALTISAEQHPDLFWAVRGGGGNFGVVTKFVFQAHPVEGKVLSVELDFDVAAAHDAVEQWSDLSRSAPREATFIAEVYARTVTLGFVWVGDIARGNKFAETFAELGGHAVARRSEEMTYLDLQVREDNTQEHSVRRYWKGFYLTDMTSTAITAFLDHDPEFVGSIVCHGGAISDVAPDATAFSHRNIGFEYVGLVRWTDPAEDEHWIAWARSQAAPLAAHATGTYVNTLETRGATGVGTAYSPPSLARLAVIKRTWDPDNVFHLNHNISPQ
jgi:FAD/FMN-containing dehydrogenase